MPRAKITVLGAPLSSEADHPAFGVARAVSAEEALDRDGAREALTAEQRIVKTWADEHPTAGAWQLHESRVRAAQDAAVQRRFHGLLGSGGTNT